MKPTLDPVVFFHRQYNEVTPALAFDAGTPEAAKRWQKKARAKLGELLGEVPPIGGKVPCKVINKVQRNGYTRTRVHLEVCPGLLANGYYLVPDRCKPNQPAMLCVPGHGYGVDDIVGIKEDGSERDDKSGYHHDYAIQCVERGWPTLALEIMGFGDRREEEFKKKEGKGATACHIPSTQALMLGRTITGYRVFDCRRGIDWLSAQPEVNPDRIGMMGISGGGLVTLFTAAMEPRIKACLVSGYLNTFHASVYSLFHCVDNFIPGILNWFEMPDLVGLIAPRWGFFEQGLKDPIFPIKAFRQAQKQVKGIYKTFGVPERCGFENFDTGHEFGGKAGFPFIERGLWD